MKMLSLEIEEFQKEQQSDPTSVSKFSIEKFIELNRKINSIWEKIKSQNDFDIESGINWFVKQINKLARVLPRSENDYH